MAWFHQKLKGIKKASRKGEWEAVRRIIEEHRDHPDRTLFENELHRASGSIHDYFESLANIANLLRSVDLEEGQLMPEDKEVWLKKFLKKASESVEHFEEVLIRLIKEGKLKE